MSKSEAILDKCFGNYEFPSDMNSSDVQSLREWISKQPHLPHISDREISIFLHSCYSAIEVTKKTIDVYYTIRTHASELFADRTPEEIAETSKVVYCIYVPRPLPDQCHVMMLGFQNSDPNVFNLLDAIRFGTSVLDTLINENPYMISFRFVFDMTGFSFGHLTKISAGLGTVRKILCYVQDALPVRLKGIHVFNAMPIINQLLMLIKPLMKGELYELINIHPTNDIESFYKFVPKSNLPENYGGKEHSVNELISIAIEKFTNYQEWFEYDNKVNKVDEQKRCGKPKNDTDIFGMDGSFKKLDID